jgi:hypothetical protein
MGMANESARARRRTAKKVQQGAEVDLSKPAMPMAQAKRALARSTKKLRALGGELRARQYAMGKELLLVQELRLHLAGGFARLEDYAQKELGLSKDLAFKYMRVADAYTAKMVIAAGVEKLDEMLSYMALTPEEEKARDVATLRVKVPDEGGRLIEMPFTETTVADLRAANAHQREERDTERDRSSIPDSVAARAVKANRALDDEVGKKAAPLANLRLEPTGAGEIFVQVTGVPLSRAAKAFRALAAALRR